MFSGMPWWWYALFHVLLSHATVISMTLYLHRYQTHRSIQKMRVVLDHSFRAFLFLTTGIITRQWVAVHRKHHARVETRMDPHSPAWYGLARVFWLGVFLYRREAKNRETLEKYGYGTPNDVIERYLYTPCSFAGVFVLLGIFFVLFGWKGIVLWGLHVMTSVLVGGFINGIGHAWGYRNYATQDQSRNIWRCGLLVGGEELHNNHHRFQKRAKFSVRPDEVDIGWMYILLFLKLSLVRVGSNRV